MPDLRTIILAAGKGTRMKSDLPKVLHQVGGRPIIQYVIDVVKAVGSLKTYIVVGHQGTKVEAFLGKGFCCVEQKKLLGTADAVRCTEKELRAYHGDVLILCGDTPLLDKAVIKQVVQKHRKTKASVTFLTATVNDPQGYGRIIRNERGQAVVIREEKDADASEKKIKEINAGVYCFRSQDLFSVLKAIKLNKKKKEFYLTDIVELFVNKGLKAKTVETQDVSSCLGVNTKEDLAVAETVMRERILKNFMLQGVTIIDPKTTYIDADVKIGKDTVIRPFTFIERDVHIGNTCCIGPFARLRPGVRLSDSVEIGNFTEVSRTKMGKGTYMKHFSYLGDAVVGSKVNIGAGAITANFDGKNKNITKIDDEAFIGSDSVLVAPVTVGKKAVIGAGSVVTKGTKVPPRKVAMGIPARVR
ncbi:N-acetylglucosamine-1-phosphate uridyltransferase / Glucosamine-1-phosphate N-acetyltransferase [hydrothermal vent metagenome]|uniref:N-acetylglucosamine-1-phosphate uridyltransferase / Glucosamine-1-phosphate N-acetyltransferase n=1 Tax=hydrothermal vent metagenome TaxID=652676 RepID=A0A3B1DJC8_9ZZZZ